MTVPNQTLNIIDPGPGTTSAPVTVQRVISGISVGGTAVINVPTSVGDITQVRAICGYGPAAEDVAYALQEYGGPVIFIRHNVSGSALSAQAMVHVGTGVALPTLAGVPNDEYNILITIIATGALGAGTFKYSLDGFSAAIAPTDSNVRVLPSGTTFLIPNTGITVTFAAGTYVAGDTFSFSALPSIPGTTDLAAVKTALVASPQTVIDLWHVSGTQVSASVAATLAAAFAGHLTTLTATQRYARGMIDIGSGDTKANVLTSALTWANTRVLPCYGYTLQASCLPYEGFSTRQVGCIASIGPRAMREAISSDLSRTAAGNVNNVLAISFDSTYDTTIDAAQISTMRTWSGKPGFYICGGKLKCPFGSNFTDMQYGRVMDVACLTTYNAQFPFQSSSFRTTVTGTVDPRDAKTMSETVQGALDDALTSPINAEGQPGHVSSVTYSISLANNLLTSGQLQTQVAIVALGYAKTITTNLFFTVQRAA